MFGVPEKTWEEEIKELVPPRIEQVLANQPQNEVMSTLEEVERMVKYLQEEFLVTVHGNEVALKTLDKLRKLMGKEK
jgi:copper homeostasis protein CutC